MEIKFIGVTGGSGVGKSTICDTLKNKYPENIQLVQLDDYFKPSAEKPTLEGLVNSDHPDSLDFNKLYNDLIQLGQNKSVVIHTKNPYLNPDYVNTKERIPIQFSPKPIVMIEGFLILHDERIRKLLSTSIFLEAGHDMRWARRANYSNKNEEYEKKVIIPMHTQYVEPAKEYAEHVIDVSNMSKEEVLEKTENILSQTGLLKVN